jgi:hypothetical protein
MGIAMLSAAIAGGREARAGITLTGGFKPVTNDPPYDYIFDVYLNPKSEIGNPTTIAQFFHPTHFTITGLVGVTDDSLASSIGDLGDPVYWAPSISQTSFCSPYVSSVSWSFLGTQPIINNSSTKSLFLGQFEVETTVNFTKGPPVKSGTAVNYSLTVTDSNGHTVSTTPGTVQLFSLVPEPSSAAIVLLTAGTAGSVTLIARVRRRRKATARTDG